MTFLTRILAAFGLIHDPATALQLPKEAKKTAKSIVPENVTFTPAGLFKRENLEAGAEWSKAESEKAVKKGERNPVLTDLDRAEIEARKIAFDAIKAQTIKQLWAANVTASEAALTISKKGFGVSTIEKYYAAFSAAFCD